MPSSVCQWWLVSTCRYLCLDQSALASPCSNGALTQYGNWSGCYNETDPMTYECFWTNPRAEEMYRNHMLKVVSRVNTVNGRLWRYGLGVV